MSNKGFVPPVHLVTVVNKRRHMSERWNDMTTPKLRSTVLSLLLCAAILVLTPVSARAQATKGDSAQPKSGGRARVLLAGEPTNLDMTRIRDNNTFIIGEHIYEGLFRMTPDGPVPWLATDVKVSTDEKTWTFKLRNGVKFHDGTPFNALAVKHNFDRIIGGDAFVYRNLLGPLESVKVIDDRTVQMQMKTPYGPYRSILAFTYFYIQSPTALKQYGKDYSPHAAGTGPYRLDSWQRGQALVLARNPDYWGDRPHLDKLVFASISDPAARVAALEAGDADLTIPVPESEVERLRRSADLKVVAGTTSRTQWLKPNNLQKPFDNPKVRLAVAYATNRPGYISGLLGGHAKPAHNVIGPGVVNYVEFDPIPYDPARAKSLLAEAGLPSGFSTSLHCAPNDELLCQAIAQDLAKVGIKVGFQTMEWTTLLRFMGKPAKETEYKMVVHSRISQYLDAEFPIYTDFHSNFWRPNGSNGVFYKNADVDSLLATARETANPQKRGQLFAKAEKIIWSEMPLVPLYNMQFLLGASRRLKNVITTPNERVLLMKAWLDE